MSEKEMTARIMANISELDGRKILLKKLSEDEKKKYLRSYKRFVLKNKKVGGSYKIFKPQSDMTIEEILAAIYPLNARVIMIDYISLLKGVDGDQAWQKLGEVARYCKIYAEVHKKIIVLAAQVNEEGKLRYSTTIGDHCNNFWSIVSTKQTREQQILNVEQVKARNGELFPFTLRALLQFMQIRDLEEREKKELERVPKTVKDNASKGYHKRGSTGDTHTNTKRASEPNNYLSDLSDEED